MAEITVWNIICRLKKKRKENTMKIKNILIVSAMVLGLSLGAGSGISYAEETAMKTFEEFTQDTDNFVKWEKEHQAHIKKIQELRDERRIKRLEYKAFTHNPNAEPKLISKTARELVMLDRQIKTLNSDFIKNTREKYGVDFAGFMFHKDFAPCFKNHYDQFAHPYDRPCYRDFDGRRPMPHHMRPYREMPPYHMPHMKGNMGYDEYEPDIAAEQQDMPANNQKGNVEQEVDM